MCVDACLAHSRLALCPPRGGRGSAMHLASGSEGALQCAEPIERRGGE
jgi:hypothetical protein